MTLGPRRGRPSPTVSVVKNRKPTSSKKLTRVRELELLVLDLVTLVEAAGGENLFALPEHEDVNTRRKLIAHERDSDGDKHDESRK